MGSDETAVTIPGGPRVIDVFDGNGAPSGPNYLLFSDADRLLEVSQGRLGSLIDVLKRLRHLRDRFQVLTYDGEESESRSHARAYIWG